MDGSIERLPRFGTGRLTAACLLAAGLALIGLAPTLRPGDIVVMDNLSSHKGGRIPEMIRAADEQSTRVLEEAQAEAARILARHDIRAILVELGSHCQLEAIAKANDEDRAMALQMLEHWVQGKKD